MQKILTQRLEDFGCSKFPVKEDGAVVCVEKATHPDQNNLHRAWGQRKRWLRDRRRRGLEETLDWSVMANVPVFRRAIWSF